MNTKNISWTLAKGVPATLPGLTSAETVDDKVTSITLDTPNGPVRIGMRDYGGLTFHTVAKPKSEKRYKVSGKVEDLDISPKYYESEYDADRQTRDHSGLKVTEVSVYLDDAGNVTGEAT